MTRDRRSAYLANLDRLQAQWLIERQGVGDCDPDSVYDIYLLAYDDEESANRAWTEAWRRRQNQLIDQFERR